MLRTLIRHARESGHPRLPLRWRANAGLLRCGSKAAPRRSWMPAFAGMTM
jgi:hypothetical protein